MGERYYDPRDGRWTQRDPLASHADLKQSNRYSYAAGDPINRSDPQGLWSVEIGGSWAAGVGVTGSINIGDDGVGATVGLATGAGADFSVMGSSSDVPRGAEVNAGGCIVVCGETSHQVSGSGLEHSGDSLGVGYGLGAYGSVTYSDYVEW